MFPRPMPIRHDAKLFPRLFGTNKTIDLPYLPLDRDIASVNEARNISLGGTLCFVMVKNISLSSPCILLYNQTAAWFGLPEDANGPCKSANATWISGWWPARGSDESAPRQPKWAPFCYGPNWGQRWPWTGCQSHRVIWANTGKHFTFSPGISTGFNATFAGSNYTDQDPHLFYVSNPFDDWLLCGVNGSCMNLEPMGMVGGGGHGVTEFSWSTSKAWGSSFAPQSISLSAHTPSGRGVFRTNAGCDMEGIKAGKNITFTYTPVCVYPPFVFIVNNASQEFQEVLSCSKNTCFYTQCWDAEKFAIAVVARMPRWLPVPVDAPNAMTLFRQRRDFGISAAIVTAISLAAVGATTVAIAMSQSVQNAQALNNISANVAHALDVQAGINAQLKGGLMVVNQRIDLVQEQIDTLWQLAQLGCQWKYSSLCITSIQYEDFTRAANLSKQLSSYLLGNWAGEFDSLMDQLQVAIVTVNSTRVDASLASGLSSWISAAMYHLKEWAGMGALVLFLIITLVICLWCICRMRIVQSRQAALMVQAFAALEAGESPQVWLSMTKDML